MKFNVIDNCKPFMEALAAGRSLLGVSKSSSQPTSTKRYRQLRVKHIIHSIQHNTILLNRSHVQCGGQTLLLISCYYLLALSSAKLYKWGKDYTNCMAHYTHTTAHYAVLTRTCIASESCRGRMKCEEAATMSCTKEPTACCLLSWLAASKKSIRSLK